MKKGHLTLVPTPISELGEITEETKNLLTKAYKSGDIICVEDLKPARRRWRSWGLDREAIEHFVCFNEHTASELEMDLINKMNKGANVYLMSDGGMPAFCDPGQGLVDLCHKNLIELRSTQSDNSVVLSLALSGYEHNQFFFAGFPPKEKSLRSSFFMELLQSQCTVIMMDTPYRLERVLQEICDINPDRELCLCLNLCSRNQNISRAKASQLLKNFAGLKENFVLVIK